MRKKLFILLLLLFSLNLLAQGQFGLGFKKSRLRLYQLAVEIITAKEDTIYVQSPSIFSSTVIFEELASEYFAVVADGDTIWSTPYQELYIFRIEVNDTDIMWVDTTGIGYFKTKLGINTLTPDDQVEVVKDAANAVIDITAYHNTEATTPLLAFRKGEGTEASHASAVDDNAVLGTASFKGYDTNSWTEGARIQAIVNGTPADNDMPTDLEFFTNTGAASATLNMTLQEDGDLVLVQDASVPATKMVGFDGDGGHTYITQSADDVLDTYVGASNIVRLDEANAANSGNSFMTLAGTSPTHSSGTPTDIWLDINPTIGVSTATATSHIVDLTFTTPAWTTSGQTNIARGIYIAPTLGAADDGTNTTVGIDIVADVTNPSAGTNAFKAINIAGLTADAQVSVTALDIGNLASAAALAERAVSIGTGWDADLYFAESAGSVVSSGTSMEFTLPTDGDDFIFDEAGTDFIVLDRTATTVESDATTGTAWQFDFDDVNSGIGMDIQSNNNLLAAGSLVKMQVVTTAANASKVLEITSSGANASSSRTQYGSHVTMTGTGTTGTNVAGYLSASGGDTDYALQSAAGGWDIVLAGDEAIVIDASTNARTMDTGILRVEHKPATTENDTRSITVNIENNNAEDTHAMVINFTATGLAPGEFGSAYTTNVITDGSTGGVIIGNEYLVTGTGSAEVHALHMGAEVIPLTQNSGTFGNMTKGYEFLTPSTYNDETTDFNATGTDEEIFANTSDAILIAFTSTFSEFGVDLAVSASNPGIKPTFEYSTGAGTWDPFTPVDETQGFRQSGDIFWIIADFTGGAWATMTETEAGGSGGVGYYWIRITRTQGGLSTPPTENQLQLSSTTIYDWDESGNVSINKLIIDAAGNYLDVSTDFDFVSAADMVLTPSGTEVHVVGGLSVGDETDVGDNNFKVVGTSLLEGVTTLTTAGVSLGAADGVLTYTGLGDGHDLTLLWDYDNHATATTIGVSSGAATIIDWGSIGHTTTGPWTTGDVTISDATPILNYIDTDGANNDINATIDVNLVTATSGAEDATFTIQHQVDGTMRDMLANIVEGDFTLTSYKGQIILKTANTTALTLEADQDGVLVGDFTVQGGSVVVGVNGQSGQLDLFSEQGGTDYTASFFANTAMTSAASFYLPADEAANDVFVTTGTDGVFDYSVASAALAATLSDEVGTDKVLFDTDPIIQTSLTARGATNTSLAVVLEADQGADDPDTWQILIADGDELAIQAYAGGSYADALTIVGSTLAADFPGALTAVSYGGITEANLVDKSAAEEISGVWEVQDDVKLYFGDGADFSIEYDEDGDDLARFAGTDVIFDSDTVFHHSSGPRHILWNNTAEDGDGGRESQLIGKGEQSGGEISTLGMIEFSHDGALDDQKGQIVISINDGDDNNAPSTVVTIDAAANIVIGATTSGSKLDVYGTVNNAGPQLRLSSLFDNGISNNELVGGVEFFSNDPDEQAIVAEIRAFADGIHSVGDLPTALCISVTKDGTSGIFEAVRIQNDGKVGFLTTAPGTNIEIADNTANAAHSFFTMLNTDETATGETGQTVDVIFELKGTVDSGTNHTNEEAAKISVYKIADYWDAANQDDNDAGLKLYTVTDGTYVLNTTFSDNDVTIADALGVTGAFTSPGIDDNADAIAITIDLTTEKVNFTADVSVGDNLYISDLGFIDFDSGDLTITHSAELLTVAGGAFDVDGAFTASTMVSDAGVSGTTGTFTGKLSALLATEQFRLSYDATNYMTVVLLDDGHTTFTTVDPDGVEADINFAPDGNVGVKTIAPSVELDVTGAIKASGTISAATYGSDGSITNAELLTLDDGAVTEILVGGGAGSAPVWTTVTGTGAPVRATSPTLVTPTLGAATATSIVASSNYLVEGYATGRNVIRSIRLEITPGGTPGTDISISDISSTIYTFNAPSITDVTNLEKNETDGQWNLNAAGEVIVLNLTENVVGILSASFAIQDLNSSTAPTYYPSVVVLSNNLVISFSLEGTSANVDLTDILDAGDTCDLLISFVTSS